MILNDVTMDTMRRSWRRRRVLPSLTAFVMDAVVVLVSIYLGWQLRAQLGWFRDAKDVDAIARSAMVPMAAIWMVLLIFVGSYAASGMGTGTTEYRRVLSATLATAGSIGVTAYLLQFPLSRGMFFLTFLVGLPLLLFCRNLLRRVIHRLHERGLMLQRVLLVGGPQQVAEVSKVLHRERWLGLDIIGAALPQGEGSGSGDTGPRILGSSARLESLAHEWKPDVVMFVGGAVDSAAEMRRAAWGLEATGARIMLVPSLTDVASDRITVRPAGGLPMMELDGPASHTRSQLLKRSFDIAGAGAVLLLASPVMALTALAIKLDDGGPVFYRQMRVGRDGLPFRCLKFRSMVTGAETMRAEVTNQLGDDHVLFKSKADPRVTRPGRFIRRFSVDELPQLFNVLQGSMSLVGPRPPLPSEVAQYSSDVHRRLAVRPGMTGLWQVSGRSDLSWDDAVRLDLYYVDNWSFLRDVAILMRTVQAVLSSRGAY